MLEKISGIAQVIILIRRALTYTEARYQPLSTAERNSKGLRKGESHYPMDNSI